MILSRASLAARDVVLEVRVTGADLGHARKRGVGERRATEVRVHEDPCRVQHAAERGTAHARELLQHSLDEWARLPACPDLLPCPLENDAGRGDRELVRLLGQAIVGQEPIDRWERTKRVSARHVVQCRLCRAYAASDGRSSRRSAVSEG